MPGSSRVIPPSHGRPAFRGMLYGQGRGTKANPVWRVDVSRFAEPILDRMQQAAVRRS